MSEYGESHEQDREDMAELAKGKDLALNGLMDRHGERLWHFLTRILRDEHEAMDLTQETFVRVYRNCAKFNLGSKFTTWLYSIASNLAKDRLRWGKRRLIISKPWLQKRDQDAQLVDVAETSPSPSEQTSLNEEAGLVKKAVKDLSEDLRIPLVLSVYEKRSYAEIGEILGCSEKAVEMKIYRARKLLKSDLSKSIHF